MALLPNDLKFAWRALRKRPLVPLTAIVSLGLAIGANAAVFSFVNAFLLRPLPFAEPAALVHLWGATPHGLSRVSVADFLDWRQNNRSFEALAAFNYTGENLTGGEVPEQVPAGRVSANTFDLLGVMPLLGRGFVAGEDHLGNHRVAVLRERFWRQRYASSTQVLGQSLEIDGVPHLIVGVMPDSVAFPLPNTELWLPRVITGIDEPRDHRRLQVVGRLAAGVSADQAQADLSRLTAALAAAHPGTNDELGARIVPLWEALNFAEEILTPMAALLMVAAALILVLACANVANLLLARGVTRAREIATRVALGAGRGRIVGQLLTETVFIALAGGMVGLALAQAGARLISRTIPPDIYRVGEIDIDPTVLLFSLALCLVAALLSGLAPALQASRVELAEGLKEGSVGAGIGAGRRRLQSFLVAGQIAGAVVLLASTALTARSLQNLRQIDLGFVPEGVLTMKMRLPAERYDTPERVAAFHQAVAAELEALPEVRAAATTEYLPLNHEYSLAEVAIARGGEDAEPPRAVEMIVGPGYFDVLGIGLQRGRVFDERDGAGTEPVVIVDQDLASHLWPGRDPLGTSLYFDEDAPPATVVGVVAPARQVDLAGSALPTFYLPQAQYPQTYLHLLLRTTGPAASATAPARRAVAALDPQLPMTEVRSLQQVVDDFLLPQRGVASSLTFLGLGALALAALGVYALTVFFISQRVREIAIRQSLGATVGTVQRMIIGRTLRLAAVGTLVGLAGALALARLLASFLYGVQTLDPTSLLGAAAFLAATTALAGHLAARRVSRIEPVAALKEAG